MKNKIALLLLVTIVSCDKKEQVHKSADRSTTPQKETVYITKTVPAEIPKNDEVIIENNTEFIKDHKMMWKWIPEDAAVLHISKMNNGKMDATGGTTAYGSSFSLEGEIEKKSEEILEFTGKIKTFQYGRNGYHCEYNGKVNFQLSADKKYWRYAFSDCKGSTDYIDIFK